MTAFSFQLSAVQAAPVPHPAAPRRGIIQGSSAILPPFHPEETLIPCHPEERSDGLSRAHAREGICPIEGTPFAAGDPSARSARVRDDRWCGGRVRDDRWCGARVRNDGESGGASWPSDRPHRQRQGAREVPERVLAWSGVNGELPRSHHLAAAHAAADAAAGDAELLAATAQLVDHVDHLAGGGAAHRVAQRDAAAPLVGPLPR